LQLGCRCECVAGTNKQQCEQAVGHPQAVVPELCCCSWPLSGLDGGSS
jgi:hypothetical protein